MTQARDSMLMFGLGWALNHLLTKGGMPPEHAQHRHENPEEDVIDLEPVDGDPTEYAVVGGKRRDNPRRRKGRFPPEVQQHLHDAVAAGVRSASNEVADRILDLFKAKGRT